MKSQGNGEMLAYQTCSWNTWQADIAVIVAFDLLIKICSVSKTGFLIYLTFNLQVFNISSHKTILQQDLLTNLFQVVLAFDNFNFFFFLLLYLSFNFKMASLFFFFFLFVITADINSWEFKHNTAKNLVKL